MFPKVGFSSLDPLEEGGPSESAKKVNKEPIGETSAASQDLAERRLASSFVEHFFFLYSLINALFRHQTSVAPLEGERSPHERDLEQHDQTAEQAYPYCMMCAIARPSQYRVSRLPNNDKM